MAQSSQSLATFERGMNNTEQLSENEIPQVVVDAAYRVHRQLGPRLLESVYEIALAFELQERGLPVERQFALPVKYGSILFEEGFRADLLVNDLVIVEVKSVDKVIAVHKKVLLTYFRLADKPLGLLINFGSELIKNGLSRVVNGLPK
jgi:GxxExxY protein